MRYFVYIMASRPGGAIYIGSTSQLRQRVEQHRSGKGGEHTGKYKIKTLVWFEEHPDFNSAYQREHRIKRWNRAWKDQLILEVNPEWRDLTFSIPD